MQLSTDHTENTLTSPSSEESTPNKQEEMDLEATSQDKPQQETTIDSATCNQDIEVKATTASTSTTDTINNIVSTERTFVPKIAPRPNNMALEFSKTTTTTVRSKPSENETTDNTEKNLESIGLNLNMAISHHLPPLPSSFLPGIDDNMTGILLPTTKQMSSTTTETTIATNPSILPIDINNFQLPSLPNLAPFQFTQASDQQPAFFDPGETNIDLSDPSKSELLQNMISNYGTYEEFALAHPHLAAELLRREILNQKVRADNRERKKRWREQNEERNKDNDLRCRVNKRANKLFGKGESEHKQRWVKEEFTKRQFRRKDKERRRTVVDDVVSSASPATFSNHLLPSTPSSGHLPLLQDAYVSMLFNNLGSLPPAVALKLVEGIKLMETTIKNAGDDQDHALPQQLAEFLHQLQAASTPSSPSASSIASPVPSSHTMEEQTSPPAASTASSPPTDDNLSALLIQTLQQSAPLDPVTPSSPATTEYADPPVRLYPMEAIMTLMKVNAEWARQ